MNEIFVEEENTVYELDAECLKRKEEQKRREREKKEQREKQKKNGYKAQKATCSKQNRSDLWRLCLLFMILR